MLTFVGLGLYDERSITLQGRDALQEADRVFAERYTSKLVGASFEDVEAAHGVGIELRTREGVEQDPEPILAAAERGDAVFCTAGDPMISTTHVDLRLRAHERGIDTRIVHGTTAAAAASSLTGLQNYRFGKATTLPFESSHGGDGVPGSVIETIEANRERGLHTLVFLDIKVDDDREDYMTGGEAASLLAADWEATAPAVVVARAGSPEPLVRGDRLTELAGEDFGDPLHLLVIPGELHYVERDALVELAGLPADAGEDLLV
ncbi:diphthine synthase [Halapricum hydrolyticum]|uniref:Diphthine synthase n=1 Tax=Halapricum hydrolyticum TaxID=2979991 RepID=A0AAE3LDZ4_9EURY|nr:diphthine synthase [Halapricum hydrolyticum]MCU4716619.1 diphthine synthase [Halapricum hydrolyticum]MCU4725776.1 diphthine synthase [Halapricum hydrolyticum]